ncbi:MAG: hypothetical protein QW035_00790 [Candidatus Anstonellales archaeon]
MMGSEFTIRKMKKGTLERFKDQNKLIKQFGKDAVLLYKLIGEETTSTKLIEQSGLEESYVLSIVNFMKENGIIQVVEGVLPEAPPVPVKEEKGVIKIEGEFEGPPKEEIEFEREEKEVKELEVEEPKPKGRKGKKKEVMPKEELEEEKPEEKIEEGPAEIKEPKPGEIEEEKAEVGPKEELEEEKPEEKIEEGPKEEFEEEVEEREEGAKEIAEGMPKEEPDEAPAEESPLDKIMDKYGEAGLKVYSLIDGKKSVEDIANEVGTSQDRVIEMLDFMEKEGIIKMERKGEKDEKSPYAPMVEGESEILEKGESEVEVPKVVKKGIIKDLQIKTDLMLKFGDIGNTIFGLIDGKRSVIDIMLLSGAPMKTIEEVIKHLGSQGVVEVSMMARLDIRRRFGEDGYIVYKKYGKSGLALYELVGTDKGLKDMLKIVGCAKEKLVDMFAFIHGVLGIDIPVDKTMLMEQLG